MGWAKYAEDNYDAFVERQTLKGGTDETALYSFLRPTVEKVNPKEKSNFAEMFTGESYFSF
ncbi:MAG: hypothetical protein UGF89_08085 [Acutalibacteraceae bacterium]|nr:hypothetical protein [Acutalibacteraceae bacterium]